MEWIRLPANCVDRGIFSVLIDAGLPVQAYNPEAMDVAASN